MSQTKLNNPQLSPDSPNSVSAQELIPELCQNKAILALLLFSQALVIVLVVLSSGLLEFKWEKYGGLSFYVMWTVLLCAAALCQLRKRLASSNINHIMAWGFGLTLTINFIVSLIALWAYQSFFYEDLGADWLLKNSLITTILTALILHYFYLGWENRQQAKSESEARVQALQSRIRPHFLFNSMNIIASLIHIDPDKAELAVEDLSELFRASLKEAGSESSLKAEIQLCEKYINIEQLRLSDRLSVQWHLEQSLNTQTIKIPQLTIQPLVENAIYHGISPNPNGGTIDIYFDSQPLGNDKLKNILKVKNTVYDSAALKKAERHEKGNQMALKNIRHRLEVLYGDDVRLNTEQDSEYFEITIEYTQSLTQEKE